jgi:replication factor C subunit 3/5
MKTERGLALQDLLTGAYEYLETIDLKPHARIYLLDHLATTEYVSLRLKDKKESFDMEP